MTRFLAFAFLSGCAAFAQGFSDGMARSQAREGADGSHRSAAAQPGCTSDYSCGYGYTCVKAANRLDGVCAQSVTAQGIPDYAPPSPKSLGAGERQCLTFTDCPVGFTCKSDHCMKN